MPALIAAAALGMLSSCTADNPEYRDPLAPVDLKMRPASGDFEFPAGNCSDGLQDGDETDVDCGGTVCMPCGTGKRCRRTVDCTSSMCDEKSMTCVSCTDGAHDGEETDVDCGGPDCGPCAYGLSCTQGTDCATWACIQGRCSTPVSCAAIKQGNATLPDGSYLIDPDGPGGAMPFAVWCNMTFDKGGWTVLPLAFNDKKLWNIKASGEQCISGPKYDKNGSLTSFQNSSASSWSYVSMQFVPPIRVTQVWLNKLIHSTATACNNMDITYTQTPAALNDQTAESWYFAGQDPTVPLAYTFADGCNSPSYSVAGNGCSMTQSDMTSTITRQIRLSQPAPNFHMVAVQGCQSSVCDANTGQAERFHINHPPQNGAWKDGILVR